MNIVQSSSRLGESTTNKYGSKMKIIEYNSYDNLKVEFEDGYITEGRYDSFKRGGILNWSDKFILGVGYKGKGKYKLKENGKSTYLYDEWHSMLSRCYNKNQQKSIKNRSYIGCKVCDEWHNFQNFAKWYEENSYVIEGQKMRLDKDLLSKNNKIYSPDTCVIIPEILNMALQIGRTNNKSGYAGVDKRSENSYRARCSVCYEYGKSKVLNIASFNNPIDAFYSYKNFKENYVKELADIFKHQIPAKVYEALYRFEVTI